MVEVGKWINFFFFNSSKTVLSASRELWSCGRKSAVQIPKLNYHYELFLGLKKEKNELIEIK